MICLVLVQKKKKSKYLVISIPMGESLFCLFVFCLLFLFFFNVREKVILGCLVRSSDPDQLAYVQVPARFCLLGQIYILFKSQLSHLKSEGTS